MRILLSLALIVASICPALADDDECIAIAHEIGLNSATSLSHDQQKQVYLAGMCLHEWASASTDQRVQIKASYELFSGDASGSDQSIQQSQRDECQNQFGSSWQDKLTQTETKTVSAEGAAVVTACLQLHGNSLFPSLLMANDGKEITLTMQYRPNISGTVQLTAFGPIDLHLNKCSITKNGKLVAISNPADVAQTLKPTQGATISCTRQQNKQEIGGVDYDCTDETIFNISTSGPSQMIKIPRVCSETIKSSVADQLSAALKKTQNDEAALQALVVAIQGQLGSIPAQINANKVEIFNQVISVNDLQRYGACDFLAGGYGAPLAGQAWPECNDAAVSYCTNHFGVSSMGVVTGANVGPRVMRVVCVKGS